ARRGQRASAPSPRMKLSLATRMFLGQAVVLVAFGAVAIFSVAELRRSQQEMRLVSQGYLQLSQQIAAIETFHTNQARDTERLAGEQSLETRRALIRLSRLYFPPLIDRKSTRLNSSHVKISYAVFCLKKKKKANDSIKFVY